MNGWENFYVIVGSSAAALTGLMFVAVTLMPEGSGALRPSQSTMSAFATPTVMHFCAALLISAIVAAPWGSLGPPSLALAVTGLAGAGYVVIVLTRMFRQQHYEPVAEDWIWHAMLPLVAYVLLLAAGIRLRGHPHKPPFAIAAATLLLLFIGIHNAWDTVTYIALRRSRENPES